MSQPAPSHPAPSGAVLTAQNSPRLGLVDGPSAAPGSLDGAWWPRSRDLVHELAGVIVELRSVAGLRSTRISYNRALWDPTPNRVQADGHVIRLGWFASIDPDIMTFGCSDSDRRIALLVVPPETSDADAAGVMAAVCTTGSRPPAPVARP